MAQAPKIFTNDEKELFKIDMSQTELLKILNVSSKTLCKYRKIFNIPSPRTTTKGVTRQYRVKQEVRTCKNPKCSNTFTVKPAMAKRCCSRSCNMVINNPCRGSKDKGKIKNPHIKAYTRYVRQVHGASGKVYNKNKKSINPNNHPRTLCGVDGGWQLDHIITIKECFNKGWSIEKASALDNLRMLPWRENLMRNFN